MGRRAVKKCLVSSCERTNAAARGYCTLHYSRLLNHRPMEGPLFARKAPREKVFAILAALRESGQPLRASVKGGRPRNSRDPNAVQSRLAEHFGVSRQRIHQLVMEFEAQS